MYMGEDFLNPEDRESCERNWLLAQESREIGRAFKRARLHGLQRRLRSLAGLSRPVRDPVADSGAGAFELNMRDVACLVGDAEGSGLPILPRSLEAAWRLEWLQASERSRIEPFLLRRRAGYWHLVGGLRELLRLEVLRARGETAIPARSHAAAFGPRIERVAAVCPCTIDGDRIAS